MERAAALALTTLIEATWSDRSWPEARFKAWTDALEELDEGAAGTAFARLRSNHPGAPTIAEFVAATKALRTVDAGNKPESCEHCSDFGWIEAPDIVKRMKDGTEFRYTAVQPCGCKEGRARSQSAAWTEHNAPRSTAA